VRRPEHRPRYHRDLVREPMLVVRLRGTRPIRWLFRPARNFD
jgi:hypothetical protein